MSTAVKTLEIDFNASGVISGVAQANAALNSLGTTGNGVASRLTTSFGQVGTAASNASNKVNAANNNSKKLTGAMGALAASAGQAVKQIVGLGGALSNIVFAGVAGRIAAIGVGIGLIGTAAVNAASKAESQRARLATVIGDTEKAKQAYAALVQFAKETPFDVDQAVEGYSKLKALGLQPTEAAMRSYGNTAAASNKSMIQFVEAVADAAVGQNERLLEFGIKAETGAKSVKFTFDNVTTEVKRNSIAIQEYLMSIGSVKFGDAMEKQAATFSGRFAAFTDTIDQTAVKMGDAGLLSASKDFLEILTNGLEFVTPLLVSFAGLLSGLFNLFNSLVGGIGDVFGSMIGGSIGGVSALEGVNLVLNLTGHALTILGDLFGSVFAGVGVLVRGTGDLITLAFGSALDWTGVKFETAGRSWGNSMMGVLRAVKFICSRMPEYFSVVMSDIIKMFRGLGATIQALLTGNFAGAAAIAKDSLSFTSSMKANRSINRMAGRIFYDQKGADDAWNRALGRPDKVDAKFPDFPTVAPKDPPGKKKPDKKGQRIEDFWKNLQDQLSSARLYGIELEKHTKELELQRIAEREITAFEKTRISGLVQSIANEKQITSIKESIFELDNKSMLMRQRTKGLTEDQAKIEDALDTKRLAALAAGVDINGKDYQAVLAKYRVSLDTNAALERQVELSKQSLETAKQYGEAFGAGFDIKKLEDQRSNFLKEFAAGNLKDAWGKPMADTTRDAVLTGIQKAMEEAKNRPFQFAIDYAKDSVRDFGTDPARRAQAQSEYDKTMKALQGAREAGVISAEAFRASAERAGRELRDRFDEIGDRFARKIGAVSDVLGRISRNIGGRAGEALDRASRAGDSFNAFGRTQRDISETLTKAFGGENSRFVKGLSKAVGGAVAGLELGSEIGALGKAIGIKGFESGAKVGGAIGGVVGGPLGSLIGSVGGGLISSLFYKAPRGQATVTQNGVQLSGNNAKLRSAADGMAGNFQQGLANIASELGGQIGAYRLSIGMYKDSFRVNPNGGVVGGKKNSGAIAYKSEGEAIAAAINFAIKQGAITGLSDLANKAIRSLDSDSAISFVKDWNSAMDDFRAMTDPIGSSIDAIIKPLDALRKTMLQVGASSADLASLEDYRTKSLDRALKEQLSSINGFIKELNGESGGVTELTRFNKLTAEFKDLDTRLRAGDKSVDQEMLTSIGQELFSVSSSLFGTSTSAFQSVRSMLIDTSMVFKDQVSSIFTQAGASGTDNTVAAINAATASQALKQDAILKETETTNELLRELIAATNRQIAEAKKQANGTPINGQSAYRSI